MRYKNITSSLFLLTILSFFISTKNSIAYTFFSSEDLNNSPTNALAAFPSSSAAEASFLSSLISPGTEDFESFSNSLLIPANLELAFPGAGTAKLTGNAGAIIDFASPDFPSNTEHDGFGNPVNGRYPISGSKFWEIGAGSSGSFQVEMNQANGAFGFYGIDIGDFDGQLQLELFRAGTSLVTLDVPHTLGTTSTDGSVLYFGIIAENLAETFDKVAFKTTTGNNDVFGFDNLTIVSFSQIKSQAVPEPTTIALFLFGAAASFIYRHKKS